MKSALEWLNEVGETVANDCFSPDSGVPGRDSELLIARIQTDARADLLARLQKAEQQFKEAVELLKQTNSVKVTWPERDAFLAAQKEANSPSPHPDLE